MSRGQHIDWTFFEPTLRETYVAGGGVDEIYAALFGIGFRGAKAALSSFMCKNGFRLRLRGDDRAAVKAYVPAEQPDLAWTPEQEADLRRHAAAGLSVPEAAELMCVASINALRGKALRMGVVFVGGRRPELTPDQLDRLRQLVAARHTKDSIAMAMGLNVTSVTAHAKQHGIKFNCSGGAVREFDPPGKRDRAPKYDTSRMTLTARLMGDPPPGRTQWTA